MRLSFLFFLFLLSLTSCGKFNNDISVWAGQLWVAFWLPFIGGLWFMYLGYRGSQSPAIKNNVKVADKTPIYIIPKFWLGVALQLVAWGIVWYVNSNNWK